jgi:hypothetical protein
MDTFLVRAELGLAPCLQRLRKSGEISWRTAGRNAGKKAPV